MTTKRQSQRLRRQEQPAEPATPAAAIDPPPSATADTTAGVPDDTAAKRRRVPTSSSRTSRKAAAAAAAPDQEPAGQLNEFEQARQEQIRRNRERLAALGIPGLAAELAATIKQSKAPPPGKGVGVKRERRKADALPPRMSLRVRGMTADGAMAAGIDYETRNGKVVLIAGAGAAAADVAAPQPKERFPAGPVPFSSINADATSDTALLDKLKAICLDRSTQQQQQPIALGKSPSRAAKATQQQQQQQQQQLAPDRELSRLQKVQLAEGDVAKLTKDGTTCLSWHPTTSGLFLAAADKGGKVTIWDVDYQQPADSSSSDYDGVSMFAPHGDYVSALKWVGSAAGGGTKLLSCSYDGSVRMLDTHQGVFELMGDLPSDTPSEERAEWSAGELDAAGNLLLLATPTGWLYCRDLRSPQPAIAWLDCHNRKVNTLHFDPLAQHLLASSCSDGSVKIWDVRSLSQTCSSSVGGASSKSSKAPKPLCTLTHAQSSQAAYWAPDGSQRLLSISFDDTLKVWGPAGSKGGSSWAQQVSIRHNNQTGRWVVPFRPCWSPSSAAVVVGDMKRGVCVFEATAGQQRSFLTSPELMTAIPSRVAMHQGHDSPVLAAATSSGRVHVWR